MTQTHSVRVRFAPSPTGYLHVGGARTALFNWLFARHHAGVFVLRIEDTDRERSSAAMTQVILDGMTWLGLDWDEGPVHQADGLERHRSNAQALLQAGHAYRCFCTPAELDERRAAHPQGPAAFRYDRRCLVIGADTAAQRAAAGEPHTVRVRVPSGTTQWHDAVHGELTFANVDIEDFIILRSDATPVYNLAVVSDDIAMRITHVIRGDDHISNTPKQILLYRGLGHQPPVFAHVPLILGPDGKRLSKRHGATAVGDYHDQGILPDAMFNFLALLGWSPGSDEEIMTRPEIADRFSLDAINRKSAVFDTTKLEWMNGQYLAMQSAHELLANVRELLGAIASGVDETWLLRLIELLKVRVRTVRELADKARPFLAERVDYEPDAVAKHWKDHGEAATRLAQLRDAIAGVATWDESTLDTALRTLAEGLGVGAGKLIHPWRVALTGTAASAGIFEIAVLLGRDRVLQRTDDAIRALRESNVSRVL